MSARIVNAVLALFRGLVVNLNMDLGGVVEYVISASLNPVCASLILYHAVAFCILVRYFWRMCCDPVLQFVVTVEAWTMDNRHVSLG
jgi:hypothetical protein